MEKKYLVQAKSRDGGTLILYKMLEETFSLYAVMIKTMLGFFVIFHRSSSNIRSIKFQ